MNAKSSMWLLILLLSGYGVADACADSYRCGRKIVRDGDSVSRLLAVCGEPRFKDSASEMIDVDGFRKKARVQRWYYRQGSRRLEHIVLIYNGKIAAIEVGGR